MSATGSSKAVDEAPAWSCTTGTVHDNRVGSVRGAGRGTSRTSSGESSGADRNDGNDSTALSGLPGNTSLIASADAANGCGRAERTAWLRLFTGRSESSAHRHSPRETDQKPCST